AGIELSSRSAEAEKWVKTAWKSGRIRRSSVRTARACSPSPTEAAWNQTSGLAGSRWVAAHSRSRAGAASRPRCALRTAGARRNSEASGTSPATAARYERVASTPERFRSRFTCATPTSRRPRQRYLPDDADAHLSRRQSPAALLAAVRGAAAAGLRTPGMDAVARRRRPSQRCRCPAQVALPGARRAARCGAVWRADDRVRSVAGDARPEAEPGPNSAALFRIDAAGIV